jgi:glutamate 5-kinase
MEGKKIVIKLGTKAIFDSVSGKIRRDVSWGLARDVAELLRQGNEVIIVSSGAVGCGRGIVYGSDGIGVKQARAAVGQIRLMSEYESVFGEWGLHVAQFLLNKNDLNSKRLENIKTTYKNLGKKVIPIVNENDVTTTDELTFGDNDNLAVEILEKFDFDILLMMTEIGVLISEGEKVLVSDKFGVSDYDTLANIKLRSAGAGTGLSSGGLGSGGLKSKLNVARRTVELGKEFIIGKAGDSVIGVLDKKIEGTWFAKV